MRSATTHFAGFPRSRASGLDVLDELVETVAENEEGLIGRGLPLNKTGVAPARDMLIVVLESVVME